MRPDSPVSNLKVKLGKYYLTRDGRKVWIYHKDRFDQTYPFSGYFVNQIPQVPFQWKSNGLYLGAYEDPMDLISETEK